MNNKLNTKAIEKYDVRGNSKHDKELKMIQHNLKMMKRPTGQLKTISNRDKGMFQLLKTINTLMFYQGTLGITRGHLVLQSSAYDLYRACGKNFIMNHNVDSVKNLINLLCLAGAIKVLSWDDLTPQERLNSKRKTYYQCLDLREADFSRISGMDSNTKLNYATVAICYSKELADDTFSDMRTNTKRQSFNQLGMAYFTNKIAKRGAVTLQEATELLKETQPEFDYKDKWYDESLKALFLMSYFQGRLKLTTAKRARTTGLDVTPNAKVIEPVKSYAEACF